MKKGLLWFILMFWAVIVFMLVGWDFFDRPVKEGDIYVKNVETVKEVELNEFLEEYNDGSFNKIKLTNNTELKWYNFIGTGEAQTSMTWGQSNVVQKNWDVYTTTVATSLNLNDIWIDLTWDTSITIEYEERGMFTKLLLETLLPLIIIVAVFLFLIRWAMPKWGGGGPMGMFGGKWAGKQVSKDDKKLKFEEIAGMEEVKYELQEIIDFLKNPKKYQRVGAKIPVGVLLYGPPGAGKTMLARALAGEADVPFFFTSGSEFMEMLVGMWAAKVRDLFGKAKATSPSIVFIDEIDAIGKKRGQGYTWWHQEQEQTLNQILTEMDGFSKEHTVIVIAATNRPDVLDPALLRPGRFDRKILVGKPTLEERKAIIEIYLKDKQIEKDVNIDSMAIRTVDFVWADLANLVNEAALKTAKDERLKLTMLDFEYALEKIVMWPEKRIKSIKEDERKKIAYHELGHAVTAHFLEHTDPVEKISIVSRGMALGVTWMMPKEDKYLHTKAKFLDTLVTLLWGRISEEVFFWENEITTGASNDMSRVYRIAYDMVTKYGMSDLGPTMYLDDGESSWKPFKTWSEELSSKIDKEVEKIINEAYDRWEKIVEDKKDLIHKLSAVLLEKEYLTRIEFQDLIGEEKGVSNGKKE